MVSHCRQDSRQEQALRVRPVAATAAPAPLLPPPRPKTRTIHPVAAAVEDPPLARATAALAVRHRPASAAQPPRRRLRSTPSAAGWLRLCGASVCRRPYPPSGLGPPHPTTAAPAPPLPPLAASPPPRLWGGQGGRSHRLWPHHLPGPRPGRSGGGGSSFRPGLRCSDVAPPGRSPAAAAAPSLRGSAGAGSQLLRGISPRCRWDPHYSTFAAAPVALPVEITRSKMLWSPQEQAIQASPSGCEFAVLPQE